MRLPRCLLAALVGAAALCGAALPTARSSPSLEPYTGLGAWVSLYDKPAWRDPDGTVARLAARHVHTLFLETSNYRARDDVVRPALVAEFLDAAHAAELQVVAWYLPSFLSAAGALRRALASVEFETPAGNRFDSFALDVEATSVRSVPRRNARAVALAARVRRAMPPDEALGAITIAPIGNSPSYWPGYPYRGLAASVDVLLPMAYFTARAKDAAGVRDYSAATTRTVRALAGDPLVPVHLVGGVAARASTAEVRAFAEAAAACGSIGASLWELGETKPAQWRQLAPLTELGAPPPSPSAGAAPSC